MDTTPELDRLVETLIRAAKEALNDPAFREDFERWKKDNEKG